MIFNLPISDLQLLGRYMLKIGSYVLHLVTDLIVIDLI